jgi:hypothetical protein
MKDSTEVSSSPVEPVYNTSASLQSPFGDVNMLKAWCELLLRQPSMVPKNKVDVYLIIVSRIYKYIYTCIYTYIHIYIHIYIHMCKSPL